MLVEHAVLLSVWLGTGGAGLVCGVVAVKVVKRRLVTASEAEQTPQAVDELIAA